MFKESSLWEVVFDAVAIAAMLFIIVGMAETMYVVATRPPGHECKAGETKPRTEDSFESTCENGYWEYWPPVL